MTETEWLAAVSPEPMHKFLGDRASQRKWRLFACACCRRHWHWVEDTPAASAVTAAELFADGRTTEKKLRAAQGQAQETAAQFYAEFRQTDGAPPYIAHMHASACAAASAPDVRTRHALSAATFTARAFAHETTDAVSTAGDSWAAHRAAESAMHARVLRDVVGNPFRPVVFDPRWRTADVQLLAEGIYADRAFDRFPILADALQDAGCESESLLAHLRDESLLPWDRPADAPGPAPVGHTRGCWALDLVLGRS